MYTYVYIYVAKQRNSEHIILQWQQYLAMFLMPPCVGG